MKLDIGCGLNYKKPLDEWTHLNMHHGGDNNHVEMVCDWADIPLDDGACEEIWLGDVVEHVPVWDRDRVFSEWNRVLCMGGIVGGTTPNPERVMRDYVDGKLTIDEALVPNIFGWTDRPTEQHYILYTERSLTVMMARYGFEIDDFSRSPGPPHRRHWLVFYGRKYDVPRS